MKNIIFIGFVIILFVFSSCQSKRENPQAMETTNLEMPPPIDNAKIKFSPATTTSDKAVSVEEKNKESGGKEESAVSDKSRIDKKKIIKDGSVSIKVHDIEQGKKSVDALVKRLNSYYESDKFYNTGNTISYSLKIRIPSDNFEKILLLVESGIGEITEKNIQARDVTEEFIDIETRLINKKNYLKKYTEILAKASTVKDIMAVEENIRSLQEEIESQEGRLKYLNDQVAYSTLDITIFKEKEYLYKPEKQDKFIERLKTSVNAGWMGIVDLILWIIANWHIILLMIIIVFFSRRYIRNRKIRNKN